jgi:hypothetical protein
MPKHESIVMCLEKCIELMQDLPPTDQMQVVEHLVARLAFKMSDGAEANLILNGIQKHSEQLLQEMYGSKN